MSKQKQYDEHLVDLAINQHYFSNKDNLHINIVKLYRQTLTRADIFNSQGNKLIEDIREMRHEPR